MRRIQLDDTAHTERDSASLIERVMQAIHQRIARRTLEPGAKLPSIRGFAEAMGVSKSTVVEAYDRLAAEGVIQSRRGSGFYVAGHLPPLSLTRLGPQIDRAIDPFWVARQSLDSDGTTLKPGGGWLPSAWMADNGLRRALRTLARAQQSDDLTNYETSIGLQPLRQILARRLIEGGIDASPGQIVITESATQAIDFLCRFLLEPGDTVLIDDPCYTNFQALLRAHRAKLVGVPYTPAGPDVEAFTQAVTAHRPRLYVTNSAIHNPTGATLSAVTAHRLLKIAEAAHMTIIEDDIYADFEHERAPRLAAFDGLERVVHVGSFSKTLSAAVRCGYIATRRDWIESFVDLKIATSVGSSRLSSSLLLQILKDGGYRKHVADLRERLAVAMGRVTARLTDIGFTPWVKPRAGMFLWCALPEGVDSAQLARQALAENIVLAPGNAYSPSQTAGRFMRFNVAQCSDDRIFTFLEQAIRA